jgi:hypothetical protein
MKRTILIVLTLVFQKWAALAQTQINGQVTDRRGEALPGASIAVKGGYDGATADSIGRFLFKTRKKDTVRVVASYLGYEPEEQVIVLKGQPVQLQFRLKEAFNDLNAVTITAGVFEASDSKRMVMLRPMDIVTTASGGADITAVMQLLPGSNRVGEQEGLFVRGGSASETKTVIDGMIVQNPFFSSTPDVPQRGRFSPFMFKGMAFSTGGYSAQYGQALSSVLLLDTQDKVSDDNSMNAVAHLAGVGVGYTHKGTVSAQAYYSNLTPFLKLIDTNIDFIKAPQGFGGTISAIQPVNKGRGTVKSYATWSENANILGLPDYETPGKTYRFDLRNRNFFTNNTWKNVSSDGKWVWLNGFSYSNNRDRLAVGGLLSNRGDERLQGRSVVKKNWGANLENSILVGAETHRIRYENRFDTLGLSLKDHYTAVFAELEFYVTTRLAARVGVRGEYTSVINRFNAAPRLSIAYKTGDYSQVSMALGRFWQTPETWYLFLNRDLGYERADHLILNFQRIKNNRTFRMEAFEKRYGNLVREYQANFDPNPFRFPTGPTDNSGHGYARGFDVFFRDKKTIKAGDFWATYSYLDTKRQFQLYPVAAQPFFASKHNLSLVYKQFIPKIASNVGLTYTHTSGRPYYDAQSATFLSDRTKPFNDLSLAVSHIRAMRKAFVVFFASVDNILGIKNEFGFRYSADGSQRFPVRPVAYRTVFFGVSVALSRNPKVPKESKLDF